MVSFICNACGQTVRKAQVEKHYQNDCRSCDVLSCIDCGKDFHGDEYVGHTSCITEAEKYQGKLYKPKDKQNKGEHKQQEWLKQVREATKSGAVDPWLAGLLDRISEYSNVPRKKAKFQNFCKNSINVRDIRTLDKLWEIFSASAKQSPCQDETNSNGTHENGKNNLRVASPHEDTLDEEDECSEKTHDRQEDKELLQKSKEEESKKTRDSEKHIKGKKSKDSDKQATKQKSKGNKNKQDMNGNSEEVDGLKETKKQKKKRRRDHEEEIDEPCTRAKVLKVENGENKEQQNHFKWKSVIKAVLRQAPDQELPIKRLRKKVLAEFQAQGANVKELTNNELQALFAKKVTNNPKFKVKKGRVRLVK